MQMNEVGFGTGMVTGAMASAMIGAGNAVAQSVYNSRVEAAWRRWEEALRGERAARRQAEQRVDALRAEVQKLRGQLATAQLESKILRAAA